MLCALRLERQAIEKEVQVVESYLVGGGSKWHQHVKPNLVEDCYCHAEISYFEECFTKLEQPKRFDKVVKETIVIISSNACTNNGEDCYH